MDEETKRDLRRRKLFFIGQEPRAPGHRCTAGKAHYIEVFSNNDHEDDVELEIGEDDSVTRGEGTTTTTTIKGRPFHTSRRGPCVLTWGSQILDIEDQRHNARIVCLSFGGERGHPQFHRCTDGSEAGYHDRV